MKKVLLIVMVMSVVLGASAAFAKHGKPEDCRGGFPPYDFPSHKEKIFTPDMPKEIREKAAELAKLHIDLEEAISARPLNKAKAIEVHAKMQKLEQEIDSWEFERKLARIEKFRNKQELKKPGEPAPCEIPEPTPEVED